jgi:uncharacterized protein (TIGR02118 family)
MATITLLYPAVDFDLKYYLASHMPLVQKTWSPKGLQSWKVTELDPSGGYGVQCVLEFSSAEDFGKAAKEDEKEIMGDIPNYTQGKPLIVVGKVVGSG